MALPFEGLRKTMQTIQDDFVVDVVRSIVEKNSNQIIELNTEKQLFEKGIGNDGKSLVPPYSNPYKKLKQKLGQPSDRVTLRLEGDFHKSFEVIIGKQQFRINATDFKTKFLLKRYGERIFGLTNSNISQFNQFVIRPELLKEIRKKIKL
tara:strand:- start:736 stop:1185 length:450 start_codon:yes stop_codon:yes gene_type:complete